MSASIEQAIDSIVKSFQTLSTAMEDPSLLTFKQSHSHFEHLQAAMARHSFSMVVFAWLVLRDDGGRAVHSHRAVDYFTRHSGCLTPRP